MKAVLMAFSPKECEKIFSGEKTVDVRKIAPKLETPYKVYVYMTSTKERCRHWEYITAYQNSNGDIVNGSQKVVGEFVCDEIKELACLSYQEMIEYFYKPEELDGKTVKAGTALHITKPKRYDTPKELSEFSRYGYKKIEHKGSGYVFCDNTQCRYCEPDEVMAGLYRPPVCRKGGCKITRPPQSWCYVEEIEE